MKIPRKVTPNRIRDSIVEVRYNADVPFEALIGIFYQAFIDTFRYTNRPLGKQQLPIAAPSSWPQEITLSLGGLSLFHNDKIKIQLQPNSLIFNCIGDYLGWEYYITEIENALTIFNGIIEVGSYTQIGIRYISEYPNLDLNHCVKFNYSFGLPDVKSDKYSFRSEFKLDEYKVILNLNNRLFIISDNSKKPTPASIIDIDVIEENINEKDFKTILTKLERIHLKEKELFFNLLDEKFLETLNPEY